MEQFFNFLNLRFEIVTGCCNLEWFRGSIGIFRGTKAVHASIFWKGDSWYSHWHQELRVHSPRSQITSPHRLLLLCPYLLKHSQTAALLRCGQLHGLAQTRRVWREGVSEELLPWFGRSGRFRELGFHRLHRAVWRFLQRRVFRQVGQRCRGRRRRLGRRWTGRCHRRGN